MKELFTKMLAASVLIGSLATSAYAASNAPLNILNATYGNLNTTSGANRIDLTKKVQGMVSNNRLVLPQGTKRNVFNIADPAPATGGADRTQNTGRGLFIVYSVGSNIYCSITNDSAAVTLPNANDQLILNMDQPVPNDFSVSKALYGDLNLRALEEGGQNRQIADVTAKTKSMVKAGTLMFTGGSKNNFFGDPAYGIVKGFITFFTVNQNLYVQFSSEYDAATVAAQNASLIMPLVNQQTLQAQRDAEIAAQKAAAETARLAAEKAAAAKALADQQAAQALAEKQAAEKAAAEAAAQLAQQQAELKAIQDQMAADKQKALDAQKALADQQAAELAAQQSAQQATLKGFQDQIDQVKQQIVDAQKALTDQQAATQAIFDQIAAEKQKTLDAQKALADQQAATQAAQQALAKEASDAAVAKTLADRQTTAIAQEKAIEAQLSGIDNLNTAVAASTQSLATRANTINDALASLSAKLESVFSKPNTPAP